MKTKLLSLVMALGIFAMGTSANAGICTTALDTLEKSGVTGAKSCKKDCPSGVFNNDFTAAANCVAPMLQVKLQEYAKGSSALGSICYAVCNRYFCGASPEFKSVCVSICPGEKVTSCSAATLVESSAASAEEIKTTNEKMK